MSRLDFYDGLVCGALMANDAHARGRRVTVAELAAEADQKFMPDEPRPGHAVLSTILAPLHTHHTHQGTHGHSIRISKT